MKKTIIICLVIFGILVFSGCIESKNENIDKKSYSYPIYVSIGNIIKNPNEYVGKNVSIEGQLWIEFGGLSDDWYLYDEQNYKIYIVSPLPYEDSRYYKVYDYYEIKGEIIILEKTNPMPYFDYEKGEIYYKTYTEISIIPFEMTKI